MKASDIKNQSRGPSKPWAILAELQCFTPLTRFVTQHGSPVGVRTQMQFAMKLVTGVCNQIMGQISTRGMTEDQRRMWQTKLAQTVSQALANKVTREQFLQGQPGMTPAIREILNAFTTAIGVDYNTNYSPYEGLSDKDSELLVDRLQSISMIIHAMNIEAAKHGVHATSEKTRIVLEHFDATVGEVASKIPANDEDRKSVLGKVSNIVATQYSRCIEENLPLDVARNGLDMITRIVLDEPLIYTAVEQSALATEMPAAPLQSPNIDDLFAPVNPVAIRSEAKTEAGAASKLDPTTEALFQDVRNSVGDDALLMAMMEETLEQIDATRHVTFGGTDSSNNSPLSSAAPSQAQQLNADEFDFSLGGAGDQASPTPQKQAATITKPAAPVAQATKAQDSSPAADSSGITIDF